MKHFAYKAMNANSQMIEGEAHVEQESDLQRYFLERKFTPLAVQEKKESGFKRFRENVQNWRERKKFQVELITFTRQFAAAYGAGLSVSKALDLMASQTHHTNFKKALNEISEMIKNGKGVVEAFSAFPQFFDSTYLAMLISGELTGNLDTVLNYSAGLLEKKHEHQQRIKATLLYPKMVVGAITITIIVVLIFVVPAFKKIFDKFEAELPLPTQILMTASDYFVQFWWTLPAVWGMYVFISYKLKKNPDFMLWFHQLVLDTPVFGTLFLKLELTNFCTSFALLLRAGIRVTEALSISINAIQNTKLRKDLLTLIPAIEQGGTISMALQKVTIIPALMTSMITMGEETGALDKLLDRVAILYESEAEQVLKKLPTIIEPIILSFLFVMVLFLALAVYLPMWKMTQLIKK